MPELPEVETTRRGIQDAVLHHKVTALVVHEPRLRWPVPPELASIKGQRIDTLSRRGKYLIFGTRKGSALVHLGMSGSLRLSRPDEARRLHDHIELSLDSGWRLRFHDPRRFGCFLWLTEPPETHPLLAHLGPEPLEDDFDGRHLFQRARGRQVPIKSFLMDSHVVVGVGNIYANEALYRAGIHPTRAAGRISAERYDRLAEEVRLILSQAIKRGGTTLKDFISGHGEPGYFQQALEAYGRGGLPCHGCGSLLKEIRVSNRSTVYCPRCQR